MTLFLARKQSFAYSKSLDQDDEDGSRRLRAALDQQLDELYRFCLKLRQDLNTLTADVAGFAAFTASSLESYTFTAVGVDATFSHSLGTVPTHILQLRPVATQNPGVVYFGSVLPTSTQVTLRVTQAGSQAVILFA